MSLTLTRYQIERVPGVRNVRLARVGRDRGAWVCTVYALDIRRLAKRIGVEPLSRVTVPPAAPSERDIASRFDGLGTVTSCTRLHTADPAEVKFVVVLVAKDLGKSAPREGAGHGGPLGLHGSEAL